MKKRSKTIIYFIFLALFIMAAPLTIFYSLGWRINWEEGKVAQPGVFYFKVLPRSAQVFLNGKLKKKTDFFFGSALIENLSQKQYAVEIKKDGYKLWGKKLDIKNGQVTEAKNIILIPENNNYNLVADKTQNFFLSQDERKLIIQRKTDLGWSLEMTDLDANETLPLADSSSFFSVKNAPFPVQKTFPVLNLDNLEFSFDYKKILLQISSTDKKYYFILNLDKLPFVLEYVNLPSSGIETIDFKPRNSQMLLYLKSGVIYEKNITANNSGLALEKNAAFLSIAEKNIFYLDNLGFLHKTSSAFSQKEKVNTVPLKLKKGDKYDIFYSNSYLFLKTGSLLYKLNADSESFVLAQENIKNAVFNSNYKKLAVFGDKELWVLFLEKVYEQPEKEEGEKDILNNSYNNISQLFWLNNYYLLFVDNGFIKISETDNRSDINVYEIGKFKEPKIYWNQTYKKLYVLSDGAIYSLDKLIP